MISDTHPDPIKQLSSLYLEAKIKHGATQQEIEAFQSCLRKNCRDSVWRKIILTILSKHEAACLSQWDLINAIVTKIHCVFFNELMTRYVPYQPSLEIVDALKNTANLDECFVLINRTVRSFIMDTLLNALEHGLYSQMRELALKHLINSFSLEISELIWRDYNQYLLDAPNQEARTYIKKITPQFLILIDLCNTSAIHFARQYIDLKALSVRPFLSLYEYLRDDQKKIIQLFFEKFLGSLIENHTGIDVIASKLDYITQYYASSIEVVEIQNGLLSFIKNGTSLQEAQDQFNKKFQEFILSDLPNLYERKRYIQKNEPIVTYYIDGFEISRRTQLQNAMQAFEAYYEMQNNLVSMENPIPFKKWMMDYCIELIALFEITGVYAVTLLKYYLTQSMFALQQFLHTLKSINNKSTWLITPTFKLFFKQLLRQHQEYLQGSPDKIVKLIIQLACLDLDNEENLVENCMAVSNYSACIDLINVAVQQHLLDDFLLDEGQLSFAKVMLTDQDPLVMVGFFESLGPVRSKAVWQAYQDFVSQYEKADEHAAPEHQTAFPTFIKSYLATFLKLFHLFDLALFPFLKSHLGASTLKLLRFFAQVKELNRDGIDMIKLCLAKWPMDTAYAYQQLENLCIAGGSMQLLLKFDSNNQFPATKMACTLAPTFIAALDIFSEFIIYLTAQKLRIPQSSKKLQDFAFAKLTRLLLAAKSMENDQYEEMYYAMLQADFSPNEDFSSLITGAMSNSILSQRLAAHNRAIATILQKADIDILLATSYPKSTSFTLNFTSGNIDFINLFRAVWQFICLLEEKLNGVPDQIVVRKIVQESLVAIAKVKDEILKGQQTFTVKLERIKTNSIQKLITKLTDKIRKFKQDDIQGLSLTPLRSVYEFNDHLAQNLTQLISATAKIPNVSRVGLFHQKSFHLEVWDKKRIDTLFLGDYVSCCLATDGSQFPAMVQRRLDNALFFIVVIDEVSNEPVALNWLFYGADKKAPGDIYVVANFFEIRPALGLNLIMRHGLLSRLLLYTGEFAETIKAKGLLIQPFSYGLMQDDLDFLPKVKIRVTKIGGCFHPQEVTKYEQRQNRYFLSSLDAKEFHRFDATLVTEKFKVPRPALINVADVQGAEMQNAASNPNFST